MQWHVMDKQTALDSPKWWKISKKVNLTVGSIHAENYGAHIMQVKSWGTRAVSFMSQSCIFFLVAPSNVNEIISLSSTIIFYVQPISNDSHLTFYSLLLSSATHKCIRCHSNHRSVINHPSIHSQTHFMDIIA